MLELEAIKDEDRFQDLFMPKTREMVHPALTKGFSQPNRVNPPPSLALFPEKRPGNFRKFKLYTGLQTLGGRPKRKAAMSIGERRRAKKRPKRMIDSDGSGTVLWLTVYCMCCMYSMFTILLGLKRIL